MFDLSLAFLYTLLKDGWTRLRRERRELSTAQIVELRHKWKPQFEERVRTRQHEKLRSDVIIRDMRRVDAYPELKDNEKGISPWFRVSLIGTYHRGVMVGLSWEDLVVDEKTRQLRYPDRKAGEEGNITAMLTGFIPYELIHSVDWDGDEYYGFPHIYCYFGAKSREPYEKIAFCAKRNLDEWEYFSEIATYKEVRKLSRKRGLNRY